MDQRRFATITSLLAAGAASLALANGAYAAATILPADIDALPRGGTVESGQVIVKLASGRGSALKGAGEVTLKGSNLSLLADPDADVYIDPTSMKGSVGIDGSLSIKGKSRSAKLTDITFSPGLEKTVTAKLGKKVITLGKLTGGSASFSHQADGLLKNAKLSITPAGAKAVNKVTGGGFSAGSFGTVTISVTTKELPLNSGTAKMTIDPAVLSLLSQNGYAITAEAPATFDGSVVTIPLTTGAFDPAGLTGRMLLNGKIHLQNAAGDKKIDLFGWHAAITDTQKDLYANINQSIAAPIGTFDLSGVQAGLNGKQFYGNGAKVLFSKIAVSTLKQSFGVTVTQGQLLGTVDLSGEIAGTF